MHSQAKISNVLGRKVFLCPDHAYNNKPSNWEDSPKSLGWQQNKLIRFDQLSFNVMSPVVVRASRLHS